jgi:hypothetical protein
MRDVRAIVTERGAGCDGLLWRQASFSPDENASSGRRNRVVLAPRPWCQAGGRYPAGDGGNKRRSPGRARISRKTIAWGKPGCLGCTCQIRVHSFAPFSTRRCGRSQRPAFPAPSVRERADEMQQPGRNRAAGMSAYVSSVIARSEATTLLRLLRKLRRAGSPPKLGERRRKQSTYPRGEDGLLRGVCHPAAFCADRVARNDGGRAV